MSSDRLHEKYTIKRTDGKLIKHPVFVLSPETDRHAMAALATYQEHIEKTNPVLAHDLGVWLAACGFIHGNKALEQTE